MYRCSLFKVTRIIIGSTKIINSIARLYGLKYISLCGIHHMSSGGVVTRPLQFIFCRYTTCVIEGKHTQTMWHCNSKGIVRGGFFEANYDLG